jgi:hypothetical protein
LTGSYNGDIREWIFPEIVEDVITDEPLTFPTTESKLVFSKLHAARIDCIRYCKDKVLSKSVNGKIEYWDPETQDVIHTFNIKNSSSNQCRFDVRYDKFMLQTVPFFF